MSRKIFKEMLLNALAEAHDQEHVFEVLENFPRKTMNRFEERLISAYDTAEIIGQKLNIPMFDMVDIIADVPTATPKRGKWKRHPDSKYADEWDVCTACGCGCRKRMRHGHMIEDFSYAFCPNCGADMRCKDEQMD